MLTLVEMNPHIHAEEEPDTAQSKAFGPATPVQLSVLMGVLGLIVACVWWASSISTELKGISRQLETHNAITIALDKRLVSLEAWKEIVSTVGTSAAQRLEKDMEALRKDFELHKATTTKP